MSDPNRADERDDTHHDEAREAEAGPRAEVEGAEASTAREPEPATGAPARSETAGTGASTGSGVDEGTSTSAPGAAPVLAARRRSRVGWVVAGALALGTAAFFGYRHVSAERAKAHEAQLRADCQKDDAAACSALCYRAPPDLDACLRLGNTYSSGPLDKRDEARAARLYEKVCQGGDPEGCARFGRALYNGQGIDRDPARARDHFKLACDKDNPLGCAGYGHMLMLGHGGLARDLKQGIKLFERSCAAGELRGCASLGVAYLNGQGVERDPTRALELFDRTCKADIGRGCLGKGMMLFEGIGTERDEKTAVALFETSCKGDTKDACASLGAAYLTGRGIDRDPKRGLELLLEGCDKAPPAGCVLAAELFSSGQLGAADMKKGHELLKRSCDYGQVEGCAALGRSMVLGLLGFEQTEKNAREGVKLLRDGCEQDQNAVACGMLATLELQGVPGLERNVRAAAARAEKSCEDGYAQACTIFGSLVLSGIDAKPDPKRAAGLFRTACSAADGGGCAYYAAALLDGQGVARDEKEGARLLASSCEKMGSPQGCAMYARALVLGMGPFNDKKKGVELAETLCLQGDAASCMLAAAANAEGRGVKRDLERATRFVVFACGGGFEPACKAKQRLPKGMVEKLERELGDSVEKAKAMASSSANPPLPGAPGPLLPPPGP